MQRVSFAAQWLVLVLALTFLAGSVAINLVREYRATREGERERLLSQARVVSQNAVHNLGAIHRVLTQLRGRAGDAGPALNERLSLLVDAMPGVRTLLITDAAGKVTAGNRSELMGRNFAFRDYFKVPQQHPDAATLYVSKPFLGTLGVYSLNVSVAAINASGEFQGIISATLDPLYFSTLMQSVRYTEDTRCLLIHQDGDVLMAIPAPPGTAGTNLDHPDAVFSRHRASQQEASIHVARVYMTGDERMVAMQTIRSPELQMDKPLVVAVSRETRLIFSDWRGNAVRDGGAALVFALLSAMALYVFQLRQRESGRQLEAATETLRAKQDEIRESEQKYRAIVETTDTGFVILEASGTVIDANAEYVRLAGRDRLEEIVGRSPLEWTAPADQQRTRGALLKCLEDGAIRNFEADYIDSGGNLTAVEFNASAVSLRGMPQIVALCRDITGRKRDQEQIHRLAYHDSLTELPNRRLMQERLHLALVQARRFHRSLAVMFMDLDRFKEINDTLGHDIGDRLLKAIAHRLKGCVRSGDTVCRQGGDEFVVVLTEIAQPDDVRRVAEKIIRSVREPVPIDHHRLQVSISIGIAIYPVDGTDDPLELMKKADIALYDAKRAGRDRYSVHQQVVNDN